MKTCTPPAQSLARGAAGAALLHIERAAQEHQPWTTAHTMLKSCSSGLLADDHASLYLGAPAVAFALHTASAVTGGYARALDALDTQIAALTRRRIATAHARIDRRDRPQVGEFDLFYGLTGLGVYLRARRDHDTLREVLSYLVRLTLPVPAEQGRELCGWWSADPPGGAVNPRPGGHGNAGMAHGIAGPLALLSITATDGVTVAGQTDAITRICRWLDEHAHQDERSPRWPPWITRDDLGPPDAADRTGPSPRPSWCYGTPGIARAHHLAARALGCQDRARAAAHALLGCLSDPDQLGQLHDPGLCHGTAGLLHLTQRAARHPDSRGPGALAAHRDRLLDRLRAQPPGLDGELLDGQVGVQLALLAAGNNGATASGWDACLLLG